MAVNYGVFVNQCLNNFSGNDSSFVRNNFISVPNGSSAFHSLENDMLNVYNNTFYTASGDAADFSNSLPGASVNVVNNIFYSASSGSAISANSSGISYSDFNNFYSLGSTFGVFNFGAINKLSDWRTASGFDANSIFGKPALVAAAKGDLHLTKKSIIDIHAGKPILNVFEDADGEKRIGIPCIGADEIPAVLGVLNLK